MKYILNITELDTSEQRQLVYNKLKISPFSQEKMSRNCNIYILRDDRSGCFDKLYCQVWRWLQNSADIISQSTPTNQ
jgi:hypothetical protein